MKRIFTIILILCLCLTFFSGCKSENKSGDNSDNEVQSGQNQQEENSAKFLLIKVVVEGTPKNHTDGGVEDLSGNITYWNLGDEWIITYDENGNRLTRTYTNDNGTSGKYEWTYDELGNVLTEVSTENGKALHTSTMTYHKNNQKATESIKYTEAYGGGTYNVEYDSYGNMVLEEMTDTTEYYAYCKKYSYEYNDFGKMVLKKQNDLAKVPFTRWTYDEEKLLIKEENGNNEGVSSIIDYKYDENGNLLSKTKTSVKTNQVEETYTYKYDKNGQKTYESHMYSDGKGSVKEYERDADGKQLKLVVYNYESDGTKVFDYGYKYTYDKDGNMLSSARIREDGKEGAAKTIYTYYSNGSIKTKCVEDVNKTSLWKCDEYENIIEYTLTYKNNSDSIYKITFEYEKLQ